MKLIILTLLTLLLTSCVHSKYMQNEAGYQKAWCDQKDGMTEYELPDGARVDCLLDDYAVQIDFAENWGEAVKLANLHADVTGRDPGVVLIMEDVEKDYKHLLLLLNEIEDSPKGWRVWIMGPEDLG